VPVTATGRESFTVSAGSIAGASRDASNPLRDRHLRRVLSRLRAPSCGPEHPLRSLTTCPPSPADSPKSFSNAPRPAQAAGATSEAVSTRTPMPIVLDSATLRR
jgi:hypothetical protein